MAPTSGSGRDARAAAGPAPTPGTPERWQGLRTLIRARLLVAALALPAGVLLAPDSPDHRWQLMGVAAGVVAALSGLYWLGTMLRLGYRAQRWLQLAGDVALVTALAQATGGRESPFALFYVMVAITGGLQGGLTGGLVAAVASSAAFVALGVGADWGRAVTTAEASLPGPAVLASLLVILGALAGLLRRRSERARRSLERAARELDRVRLDNDAVLRHLTSGVLTLDGTGTVAYLNPAAESVLELSLQAVRGRWLPDALPARLGGLRDALLEALESHVPQSRGEVRLRTSAGEPLPLGLSTNLLWHGEAVTGVVAVFQDLTQVREMEVQARRNQTLAEVGALAAGIAHELRNGLSPISGSVECLQRELRLEGENAQLLDLISTECLRLNRFVTDLLVYARERPVVRETLDLGENLAELCRGLERDQRRGASVEIRYQPGEGEARIEADPEQLRQVWLNLAANALEAIGPRGVLAVRWFHLGDARVGVEFLDTGPGIAPDHLARVGRPFFTTKKGGTGLGLAIAQRIVERHGGSLGLAPGPEGGTVARVILSRIVGAVQRAA